MRQSGRASRYVPPFSTGDRMDRRAFHALYEQTPTRFTAELIAGVVHVSPPAGLRHTQPRSRLVGWAGRYADETPGVNALASTTTFLGSDSEPQPDLTLRVDPDRVGGQSQITTEGYVSGPAELVVEVAESPADFELRVKKGDYQRYGVREYLVVVVGVRRVVWFSRYGDRLIELTPDSDGLLKSRVFPGLWLDAAAVFADSNRRLTAALRRGLATPDHAAFVARLAAKAARHCGKKPPAREAR